MYGPAEMSILKYSQQKYGQPSMCMDGILSVVKVCPGAMVVIMRHGGRK